MFHMCVWFYVCQCLQCLCEDCISQCLCLSCVFAVVVLCREVPHWLFFPPLTAASSPGCCGSGWRNWCPGPAVAALPAPATQDPSPGPTLALRAAPGSASEWDVGQCFLSLPLPVSGLWFMYWRSPCIMNLKTMLCLHSDHITDVFLCCWYSCNQESALENWLSQAHGNLLPCSFLWLAVIITHDVTVHIIHRTLPQYTFTDICFYFSY